MDKLFLTILNMSLTGAFVIAAVCIIRLPLKKAPKIISYCLWAVAGFRLVFPFSINSVISLIPFKAAPIPRDIAMQAVPRIDSGIIVIDNAVSRVLPAAPQNISVNPLQVWIAAGAYVWLTVAAVMLVYAVVSYILMKRKMRHAAVVGKNIYEADNIQSPFLLGIIRPRIYIPAGLSDKERDYVIHHEQIHLRRYDHIVKFVAYFILCLHWFNPLVWAAFMLMGADMEMSCDERVLKEMRDVTKRDYSLSLISLATNRRIISGSPLAFGEGGVKERVKNVLNFRRHSRIVIIAAVVLASALSVGFAVNRAGFAEANDAAAANVSEDDAKAIIAELVPKAANFYSSVFNGDGAFQENKSVTIPGYPSYVLVDDAKIKSAADLKAWVEEVFTPEAAQGCFYSRYLRDLDKPLSSFDYHDYTPMYYEYEGKLYVDSNNGGRGFAFDWDYNTIKITSLSDNAITATVDRSLFGEFDETSTVNLVKSSGKWLIANDFVNGPPQISSGTSPVGAQTYNEEDYAKQYVQSVIDSFAAMKYSPFKVTDSKITKFVKIGEVDGLKPYPLSVWQLDYQLKPENAADVYIDAKIENGWITDYTGRNSQLVFSYETGQPQLLGSIEYTSAFRYDTTTPDGLKGIVAEYLQNAFGSYFGHILAVDTQRSAVRLQKAQWLTAANDSDQLKALGVDPNSLSNGFYVQEFPGETPQEFELTEATVFQVIDWNNYPQTKNLTMDEFAVWLNDHPNALCHVELSNYLVADVIEQYLP